MFLWCKTPGDIWQSGNRTTKNVLALWTICLHTQAEHYIHGKFVRNNKSSKCFLFTCMTTHINRSIGPGNKVGTRCLLWKVHKKIPRYFFSPGDCDNDTQICVYSQIKCNHKELCCTICDQITNHTVLNNSPGNQSLKLNIKK